MTSKITGGPTRLLFRAKVLNKHDVGFYQCVDTGFIQTDEPYWLDEAYEDAITKLDVGLVMRNLNLSEKVAQLLRHNFDYKGVFLDYAGGYGLFTRLMRDKGFDFHHTDKFCQNIFARYFDLSDLPNGSKFEVVTAFEVFEHLPDPLAGIKEMLEFSGNLLFSTELQPENVNKPDDWIYLSTETGQHVAFYNKRSLQVIAEKLSCNFYTDGGFLHLYSKRQITDPFSIPPLHKESFFERKARKFVESCQPAKERMPDSLLDHDYHHIKAIIHNSGDQ